ncbi:UDP-glycosyltransferase 86A2 [Amborella trichopoda]|uniref:UDP-glycosyltransferase 86A2 n=1 Tax=Amborella trichopoda TaxID=13333 RepID=UPI0005D3560D|nr:UDP-glycosyltransferase 86A2 [Amborella trichopoda]|eukprot:XP_011620495.1 UDP-glycosyltransferase 86A2 [Amborella trichopoda]
MAHPIHAIFFPYPLQGHIIPSVQLALKLASKGLTITFVNTEAVHAQTVKAYNNSLSKTLNDSIDCSNSTDDIFFGAREAGLDIRYRVVSDGLPLEFDRSLNHNQFMFSLLHVFSAHVEKIIREVALDGPPISCIIADTFFVWVAPMAEKFGVPHISFWTEPALVFSLYHHAHLLRQHGHFDSEGKNRKDPIDYIPGIPSIDPKDIPSYLQVSDTSTVVHQIILAAFNGAKRADWVLSNTVEELELHTIEALNNYFPFYAVGPILPPKFTENSISTSLWPESDCSSWLDTHPDRSVIYISFGSYAHISKEEIQEIAEGLMLSGRSFVWVLRPDIVSSDEPEPLPKDFQERTRGQGLVVHWCRQREVLSHRAIGGFLTHCGWNSIMESVWCEVPMLGLPLLTDQFTNRKLIVDDWGVGLDLMRKLRREEVKENMERVFGEEGFRERVREVRGVLARAIGEEGSSQANLDKFVVDLKRKLGGPSKGEVISFDRDVYGE